MVIIFSFAKLSDLLKIRQGNPDLGNLILDVGLKVYEIQSTGGAIGCMLVSLFFLGTWPAIIASLERRGRLPQHTALDYAISNLLAAVIMVVTIGQNGDSKPALPNFLDQLSQVINMFFDRHLFYLNILFLACG